MVTRRTIQTVLGCIWLLDGLLQLKPSMFKPAFIQQVILPVGDNQPHWISALVRFGASVVSGHLGAWNTLFVAIQLFLGLALIMNLRIKVTLVASIVWAVGVWAFGEGFGQILTGQASLIGGAPGAAIVYALIAVAIWPSQHDSKQWDPVGNRFAQLSLAVLFMLGFALRLQPSARSADGFMSELMIPWAAHSVAFYPMVISIALGIAELTIAFLFVARIQIKIAVFATLVASFLFWWIGQSFGEVLQSLSTDFNTGLLMMVLAACADPVFMNLRRSPKRQRHTFSRP